MYTISDLIGILFIIILIVLFGSFAIATLYEVIKAKRKRGRKE